MDNLIHLVCSRCGTVNRLPSARLAHHPTCGKCGAGLVAEEPIVLDEQGLMRHIAKDGVPMVVDFWAPWCGPCRMMDPAYKAAAAQLAPHVRLGKLNTEENQAIASRLGIRGIPTMILFDGGQEVARTSGAMDTRSIVAWVRQNVGRHAA